MVPSKALKISPLYPNLLGTKGYVVVVVVVVVVYGTRSTLTFPSILTMITFKFMSD
jgi:hypothetical protein